MKMLLNKIIFDTFLRSQKINYIGNRRKNKCVDCISKTKYTNIGLGLIDNQI